MSEIKKSAPKGGKPVETESADAALFPPAEAAQKDAATEPVKESLQGSKAAKKAARNDARKAARKVLSSWTRSPKLAELSLPGDFVEAMKALFGAAARGGASGGGVADKIVDFFAKIEIGGGIDEMEIFRVFKIGRGEMRKKVRELIRDGAPADRIWIAFDEVKEEWVLMGRGPKAPAGWKGYLPTEGGDK